MQCKIITSIIIILHISNKVIYYIYFVQQLNFLKKHHLLIFEFKYFLYFRFTTDLDTLDVIIFYKMDLWLCCVFAAMCSFAIIGINTPLFLAFILPIVAVYLVMQVIYSLLQYILASTCKRGNFYLSVYNTTATMHKCHT